MTEKSRIEPVSYWRKWWKLHSTWYNAAGIFILGFCELAPQHAFEAWAMLPSDFRQTIPPNYLMIVALICWVIAFFARFIKQKKLEPEVKTDEQSS